MDHRIVNVGLVQQRSQHDKGKNVSRACDGIREAARQGYGLERLVPRAVAEYIAKLKIYDANEEPGAPEPPRL